MNYDTQNIKTRYEPRKDGETPSRLVAADIEFLRNVPNNSNDNVFDLESDIFDLELFDDQEDISTTLTKEELLRLTVRLMTSEQDLEDVSKLIKCAKDNLPPEQTAFILEKPPHKLQIQIENGAQIMGLFNGASLIACAGLTNVFSYADEGVPKEAQERLPDRKDAALLSTTAVLPPERGLGLQQAMTVIRASVARADEADFLFSEVAVQNAPSFGSLLKCGLSIRAMYNNTEDNEPCYGLVGSLDKVYEAFEEAACVRKDLERRAVRAHHFTNIEDIKKSLDDGLEGVIWDRKKEEIVFARQ